MSGAASNHLSLFPDSDDVLLRYQADDERRQQELAAARERAARRERGELREANLRGEVAELRAEIAALPKMLNERSDALLDITGEVVGDTVRKIYDHIDGRVQATQRELFALVEKRFAELSAKLDILAAADGRPRSKGSSEPFRFAGEKGDSDGVIDLPNPLRLGRTVN